MENKLKEIQAIAFAAIYGEGNKTHDEVTDDMRRILHRVNVVLYELRTKQGRRDNGKA